MTADQGQVGSEPHPGTPVMTRAEIARAVGLEEQAVSNWVRRHADFPGQIQGERREGYPVAEVVEWLDRRKIQRSDLQESEQHGRTYGHRFRDAVGPRTVPARVERPAREPFSRLADDLWKRLDRERKQSDDPGMYQELIMSLLCLRAADPMSWALITRASPTTIRDAFSRVWQAQSAPLGQASDLLRRIQADTWWSSRLVTAVSLLQRHVTPADALPGPSMSGRITTVEAFGYLLDRFAQARHRSTDEYLTPAELASLMVEIADPGSTERVHNPCCSAGEILAALLTRRQHSTMTAATGLISGRARAERTWHLAAMNVAVHGGHVDLGDGPSYDPDEVDLGTGPYDVIVMNPPFSKSRWHLPPAGLPASWSYGEPPAHNANFAWLQLAVAALKPGGRAVVIMPQAATNSQNSRERQIRGDMVNDGAVRCVIDLPGHLFRETSSAATVWVLGRPDGRPPRDVLLIDGKRAVRADGRTHRILTEAGCDAILDHYRGWLNGTGGLTERTNDVTATTATIEEIKQHDYDLRPAVYLQQPAPGDTAPLQESNPYELRAKLDRLHDLAAAADLTFDQQLDRLRPWTP